MCGHEAVGGQRAKPPEDTPTQHRPVCPRVQAACAATAGHLSAGHLCQGLAASHPALARPRRRSAGTRHAGLVREG